MIKSQDELDLEVKELVEALEKIADPRKREKRKIGANSIAKEIARELRSGNLKKPRTAAQKERQGREHRNGGKYTKVNPCRGCGKSAGVDYCSHHLTDTGDWKDAALVLCLKCAKRTQDMTDVKEFKAYAKANGGSK